MARPCTNIRFAPARSNKCESRAGVERVWLRIQVAGVNRHRASLSRGRELQCDELATAKHDCLEQVRNIHDMHETNDQIAPGRLKDTTDAHRCGSRPTYACTNACDVDLDVDKVSITLASHASCKYLYIPLHHATKPAEPRLCRNCCESVIQTSHILGWNRPGYARSGYARLLPGG
jgi:hypothetical protein